jgi:histone H3/H4
MNRKKITVFERSTTHILHPEQYKKMLTNDETEMGVPTEAEVVIAVVTAKQPRKKSKASRMRGFAKKVATLAAKPTPMIPVAIFTRLVKEISRDIGGAGCDKRFGGDAMRMLQHTAEEYVTERICLAEKFARHSGRHTTTARDFQLACKTIEAKK